MSALDEQRDGQPRNSFCSALQPCSRAAGERNLDDAVREYQTALRVYPDDAVVNNAMASALLATGRAEQAVAYLKAG
jgi:predicted Zn-dependent protease